MKYCICAQECLCQRIYQTLINALHYHDLLMEYREAPWSPPRIAWWKRSMYLKMDIYSHQALDLINSREYCHYSMKSSANSNIACITSFGTDQNMLQKLQCCCQSLRPFCAMFSSFWSASVELLTLKLPKQRRGFRKFNNLHISWSPPLFGAIFGGLYVFQIKIQIFHGQLFTESSQSF